MRFILITFEKIEAKQKQATLDPLDKIQLQPVTKITGRSKPDQRCISGRGKL